MASTSDTHDALTPDAPAWGSAMVTDFHKNLREWFLGFEQSNHHQKLQE